MTGPWSLRALVADLAAGRTTPEAAVAEARSRIAAASFNAWVSSAYVPASAGPLGGVPLGVKDIIDLAGLPTRCGSVLRADASPATVDASIVREWRRAGAVPIGKTVTTEFAFFAPGPTDNPAAPGHTPGGSSSGSAAAVAAGHVPLALGSQTAGSVTRPAAFCGVASLVMSRGRFPVDGVTGLSPSLDSHGMFTATVSDLALAWSALSGEPEVEASVPRLLVWSSPDVSPAMEKALRTAVSQLRADGAVVDEFPDPALVAALTAAHPVVMAYEAARERSVELASADRLSDPLAQLLRTGAEMPRAEYEAALDVVTSGGSRLAEIVTGYDAVLTPAALGSAPSGLAATGDPVLSRPWQALGLPVIAVPGLRDAAGLPLGLQLVGSASGEAALLGTGRWVETALKR
ncbi:Asp-tRNA(Asn)/Glu-tRNA(Gln) amidotransferase A subunit family amidase [Amycolatopsis echigonensis]|uniref:Asp-tRNA(Asn)/Glu-tRNA(Gln) amidotransferase A subunit family amidase n=1 Tax=Amycolatopsis echigonensis TaxID=2576905 RepID=A0A2N3WIC7_9PSEU|nr:amidase [Amycolatopsis niigatensis]PKV93627.1 Asp-tRNA(Asn)/Glu-tRNA(Gln) amidotransferase A subunit family amidase [Amycolatopsis niigatensis]